MLGKHILKNYKLDFIAPSHNEMDITSFNSVASFISYRKDSIKYVIHAAALTGLQRCEENPDKAYVTNVLGTINVCKVASVYDIPVFHISTDYVFDGKNGNYKESDTVNPLSVYAKTKALGEAAVMMVNGCIFRTSFCKSPWPYAGAYFDKHTSFDTLEVISDLIIRCAGEIFDYPDVYSDQILHIGTERKSIYDLAKKISPSVLPIPLNGVIPNPLIPHDTSFDTTKLKKLLAGIKHDA